jgi:hypothetical protein
MSLRWWSKEKDFIVAFFYYTYTEFFLKELHIVQGVGRWIVCTPLSVKASAKLALQEHLEYRC